MNEKFLFNKKDTAQVMGVSVQALSQWDVDPVKKVGRQVFYYLPNVIDSRLTRETEESLSLTAERARLASEQADGHALKNALAKDEIAPISILELALSRVAELINSVLDSLPLKLKKQCPKLNARDIELIRRIIVKLQNEISEIRLK